MAGSVVSGVIVERPRTLEPAPATLGMSVRDYPSILASSLRMVDVDGRSPIDLPTYLYLITPSRSTTNVDGVARPSFRRSNTMNDFGASFEGSYRMGNGMSTRTRCTSSVAPARLSTLIATTSALSPLISSYSFVSSTS